MLTHSYVYKSFFIFHLLLTFLFSIFYDYKTHQFRMGRNKEKYIKEHIEFHLKLHHFKSKVMLFNLNSISTKPSL